jgi:alpha-L-arabinofuranosidase
MHAIKINPRPKFFLSPNRFMQFMEPLGTTDSSVEAGWNFETHQWREDLVDTTRALAPGMIRWPGGILTSYYRWREAVGPREQRVPMLNILWGGMETNQIGTHEFIDFCRLVDSEPLIAVNFEADGNPRWSHPKNGQVRSAGPEEAAQWVAYCNAPANAERAANGAAEPFNVKTWQIGNETSYGKDGFDCETAAQRTLAFARAMRQADPEIHLIAWGDSGWAPRMLEVVGEEVQYIAFHHHFNAGLLDPNFNDTGFRDDPAKAWEHLMGAATSTEEKLVEMRRQTEGYPVFLAMTESHFGLRGRNRGDILASWAAGVANARILNVHERHGDRLKIATLADFCGTRWMNNAVMIPVPGGFKSYLMPVGAVMALFRRYSGEAEVEVTPDVDGLDITASRTDDILYLHVVNTNLSRAVSAEIQVDGMQVQAGKVYQVAADPIQQVSQFYPDVFQPQTLDLPQGASWTFPAASVSVLELSVQEVGT